MSILDEFIFIISHFKSYKKSHFKINNFPESALFLFTDRRYTIYGVVSGHGARNHRSSESLPVACGRLKIQVENNLKRRTLRCE